MAMIFKPKEITKDKLNTLPIVAGQMITCSDTGELYFDTSSNQRITISDFIFCDTLEEFGNLTTYLTDKLYLIKENNYILRYNGNSFVHLNPKVEILREIITDSESDATVHNMGIIANMIYFFKLPFSYNSTDTVFIYLNSVLLMDGIDYVIEFDVAVSEYYVHFIDGVPTYVDGNTKFYLINYKNSKTAIPV